MTTNEDNNIQKRKRGQNKNRDLIQSHDSKRLCFFVLKGKTCTLPDCDKEHDVSAYLEAKDDDITNTECHLLKKFGFCKFGATCRFFGTHSNVLENSDDFDYEKEVAKMDTEYLNILLYGFQKVLFLFLIS